MVADRTPSERTNSCRRRQRVASSLSAGQLDGHAHAVQRPQLAAVLELVAEHDRRQLRRLEQAEDAELPEGGEADVDRVLQVPRAGQVAVDVEVA
jgi:hypothetical protein